VGIQASTIQSLTTSTTVTFSGGTLNVTGSIQSLAGQLTLQGATLGTGTIVAGTTLVGTSGTLSGVTISGGLQVAAADGLTVSNCLTLNGTATLGGSGSNNYGYLNFSGSQTLGGSGTVVFSGTGLYDSLGIGTGTLTIGSGITVKGQTGYVGYSPEVGGSPSSITVVNQGTIEANVSGGTITIQDAATPNTGTLDASSGGTLSLLSTNFTPGGTLEADAGSTVTIGGTIVNTGAVFSPTGSGTVTITGTIQGGTVDVGTGTNLVLAGSILNGVTLSGTYQLAANGVIEIEGGLTLNGTLTLGSGSNFGVLYFIGNGTSQTLGGSGTVVFSGTGLYDSLGIGTGTLTIGSGITVKGQTGYVGYSPEVGGSPSSITVVNQGTIEANVSGGTITIQDAATPNTGTLDASNGGTLSLLSTNFTPGGTLEADAGSTVTISGTIVNTGGIFSPTGSGTVAITGTIRGGTVSAGTGTTVNLAGSLLNGVTLSGNYPVAGNSSVTVQNGLTLNGTLTLGGSSGYGYLSFQGTQTLGGSGTVAFGSSSADNAVWPTTAGSTLTIGAGIMVRGQTGYVGYDPNLGGSPTVAVINQGTIQADVSGKTITVYGTGSQNSGSLKALNGATLSIQGTLTNTATVSVDSTSVLSVSGTLTGGTIVLQAGAQIHGSALSGVTVNGSFTVAGNSGVTVQNGLTLNGTLTLGGSSGYGYLNFQGTQTLGGSSTVAFGSSSATNALWLPNSGSSLTIGAGITVRGQTGDVGYDPNLGGSTAVTVVNQGTIQADVSSGTITINGTGATFLNSGTVNASLGTISISTGGSGTTNSGTLSTGPTGALNITGPFTQTSTGSFDAVLGGATTGLYGHAAGNGTAALGGSLNVSEANGFTPGTGNTFTILTFASATGQFANYTGLVLNASTALQPAYNPASVTLTTVTNTTVAPDLRVTNLSLNPANPQSSQTVTVNWDDINAGNGATGGSWTDHVVVTNTSTGQTVATTDVPYNAATNGALAPGGSFALSSTFRLPDGPAGVGTLLVSVTTDYYNTIAEYYPGNVGESNNTTTLTAASTLAAYPDLQVSGLAVTTASPESGQNLTITWNDANTGQAATSGNWTDQVQVVNTTTGQTLTTASVPYNAATSGNIAPGATSPLLSYTTRLPDGPAGVGHLTITVTVNSTGTLYEYNSAGTAQTNNTASVTTSSTLAPYPDLQVTGLVTSPSTLRSGTTVTATWNDANTGNAPVSGSFTDYVTVVNTTTGQTLASGFVAYNETTSGAIAAGGSAPQQYSFTLPNGNHGVGQIKMSVTTDYYNAIFEYNSSGTAESNNTSSITVPSTLALYPDLQVTALATTPTSPESGQTLTVSWDDSNTGNAPVTGSFVDDVTVVNTTTGQTLASGDVRYNESSAGPIAAGGSVPQQYSFMLPGGNPGVGQLSVTVTTDADNQVFESNGSGTGETNNTASITVASTIAPYPDLQVTALSFSPSSGLQSGDPLTIDWTDANTGNAPVSSSFYDRVTVTNTTTGQTIASGDVYHDASSAGSGPIAAGSSAPGAFAFTLPNGAPGVGNLSVTVTTDKYNQVFEYNASGTAETNNSATVTATSAAAPYPDLQVEGLAVIPMAPVSGGTFQVSWDDANTGNAPVGGPFSDRLTIVNTTTGVTLLSTLIGYNRALPGNAPIAAGGSQPQAYSFTLPQGNPGAGNLSISVTTDALNQVFEYNAAGTGETNKTATQQVTSALAPYPDLAVSGVTAAATAAPGQSLTVGWTLTNGGGAGATAPWTEQVLLATDAAGDDPTLLRVQTDSMSLAAGQSVPRSAVVTVPSLPAGNYWLEVVESPLGQVFEVNTANNTAVAGQPTSVAGALALTLAASSVSDAAGSNATTATVTRNTATTNPLVVTIANSDPTDVTVPATVTIPAGATSATFPVGTINNHVVDGTQTATLTASATGEGSGSDTLTVTDSNVPTLNVALNSHSLNESDPNPATSGTVTRNTSTSGQLVVSLLSNATNKITVPATVTIPAGQASATFPVTVVNDHQVDGNATAKVMASATGFVVGSDSAVVVDDNLPTLSLILAQHTVSEAAGSGATSGTVSLSAALASPLVVSLSSSLTSAATVPATVTVLPGQMSAAFPVNAVDDGLDLGDATTVISAEVVTSNEVNLATSQVSDSLTVTEHDGPALTLAFSTTAIAQSGSTPATVTRNTPTTSPLVVTLTSSATTHATVPVSVSIPAGQSSASFVVSGVNDGLEDGEQSSQITASSPGFGPGIATIYVTNVNLPDLSVASLASPATSFAGSIVTFNWTATNHGLYPAYGTWDDDLYLDPLDGQGGGGLVASIPYTGPLGAGASYSQSVAVPLPTTAGRYSVRLVVDADQNLEELSFGDNTAVAGQPLNVQPPFSATVSTTVASPVRNGIAIPLTGQVTAVAPGQPIAGVPVDVQVLVNGSQRTLTATTDASGRFTTSFQPLPNETGVYAVAAGYPGAPTGSAQA
jgi:hypothetical protein